MAEETNCKKRKIAPTTNTPKSSIDPNVILDVKINPAIDLDVKNELNERDFIGNDTNSIYVGVIANNILSTDVKIHKIKDFIPGLIGITEAVPYDSMHNLLNGCNVQTLDDCANVSKIININLIKGYSNLIRHKLTTNQCIKVRFNKLLSINFEGGPSYNRVTYKIPSYLIPSIMELELNKHFGETWKPIIKIYKFEKNEFIGWDINT